MITISDGILTIPEDERFVGFSGDNLHTQKKFFIRSNTQSGWLYRLYLTFDNSTHNFFVLPSTVTDEGTFLTWDIEEGHIFKSGLIKAQIKAFSKEKEVYHTTSDVFVAGLSTEEDEDFKNSNSEFLGFEKTLNGLYEKMEEASAKMPYVGTNGNWFTYDVNSGSYVDSGVASNGMVGNGSVTPEKLDREYWQIVSRNPVIGYDYFDAILEESFAPDTIYRIHFSGLSPIYRVVGEGSFVAVTRLDCSGLMLINVTNGDRWIYEKGSSHLTLCENGNGALEDGSVTPEKLDRNYWQIVSRNPVIGYDYFDAILEESFAPDTIYRIHFSGFSPMYRIVGEGSFVAITRLDASGLLLLNVANGDMWTYKKGSNELKRCTAQGTAADIETLTNPTASVTLESAKEYRLTENGLMSLALSLPETVEENFECLLVFKSGDNATRLTCPSQVKWSGDDVASVTNTENGTALTYNCLVPQKNKTYNIIFWYDGFNVNAVARGVSND